jgi:hypothetical protein
VLPNGNAVHLTETPSSTALSKAVLRIPIPEPSAKISAKPTLRKGRGRG